MSLKFAEDYEAGDTLDLGSFDVTREEIVEFAQEYDPFPFHIDDEAAKATVFGGIISSGWLTALVWLRLMHKNFVCYETVLGSPGHEEMVWPTPVRPGDRLTGTVEIKESRVSKSKPDLGFVRYTAKLTNQNNDEVFMTTSTLIVKSRSSQSEFG
ncbi:MAG: MaoC family dehydratase [Alphaproteobacteria bacterium]|nr:MaoC family dehydratase [Alphaproteobacteria bacterium]